MQLHLPEFPAEDLLVADGTAMLFRSYHSREHHTPSGEPAGGTLGMCEGLLRLVRRHNPAYMALVFDAGQAFPTLFPNLSAFNQTCPLFPNLSALTKLVRF